ncbi:4-diphosphocytidyl-2C-methyl-D-erythritol kinase [Neisseria arctica]|uniref:4-diphosphocytidyl-2-C-methyl-D-erythritol kinase n=1 Tax=Neisseria arctica TaxID=1470200 RepID=A0A0J0YTU4_9NEIS|nr:4-(cytidine 5'-diphospho)-2-C-methyl-D-erythritol kinase [Neisseria arctica]KLT73530.1 4-diphosphocytidyl-2C-methyl-D-erythritol kinase [Neisseria arctica]UOO86196.1 4-(cytidine 5'-diphospho)-2-C-methyl-D-erythritol kinase [Neisseria arctica]
MKQKVPSNAQAFLAPAKLNLDLRITGRRPDGYHNLESIFCLIGLYDTVFLALREDSLIRLHTPTDDLPPEQDLAYRAAVLLQQYCGIRQGVDIWLDKRIPTGGGLGGGSSDAATVLMALNKLWQCAIPRKKLIDLGLSLGADVPFFIFGQNAFAKGVGEDLISMDIPNNWYVIVKPDVHVSTAIIFSHQGLTRDSKPSIMPTFQALQPFRNDMQAVVFESYPEVKEAYQYLKEYGRPQMTGSGACLFLSCSSRQDAEAIYSQISNQYQAYCVAGLSKHPLFDI